MLPYDAEALLAFHAQLNAALWPAQVAALIIAGCVLFTAARPLSGGHDPADPAPGRNVLATLAIGWAWVGGGYFFLWFSMLDFLAPAYAALFLVQALLLLRGALHDPPAFRFRRDPFGWAGLALAAIALLLLPLAGALSPAGWAAAPVVGLMPGPTALFTLGVLLLAGGAGRPGLAVVPVLWTLIAGFQGWALGLPQNLAMAALGLAAAGLLAWRRRAAANAA